MSRESADVTRVADPSQFLTRTSSPIPPSWHQHRGVSEHPFSPSSERAVPRWDTGLRTGLARLPGSLTASRRPGPNQGVLPRLTWQHGEVAASSAMAVKDDPGRHAALGLLVVHRESAQGRPSISAKVETTSITHVAVAVPKDHLDRRASQSLWHTSPWIDPRVAPPFRGLGAVGPAHRLQNRWAWRTTALRVRRRAVSGPTPLVTRRDPPTLGPTDIRCSPTRISPDLSRSVSIDRSRPGSNATDIEPQPARFCKPPARKWEHGGQPVDIVSCPAATDLHQVGADRVATTASHSPTRINRAPDTSHP